MKMAVQDYAVPQGDSTDREPVRLDKPEQTIGRSRDLVVSKVYPTLDDDDGRAKDLASRETLADNESLQRLWNMSESHRPITNHVMRPFLSRDFWVAVQVVLREGVSSRAGHHLRDFPCARLVKGYTKPHLTVPPEQ